MPRVLTRDEILAKKTGRARVELPSGGDVVIKAVTRQDVYDGDVAAETDRGARDDLLVSRALVEPKMSAADVAAWAVEGAAGDIAFLLEQIAILSGLVQGADKSRLRPVRS